MDEARFALSRTALDPGPERLGRFIEECRERRGWSQARLAREAGISQPYLSTVESGQRNWPQTIIPAIAAALGVHEAYFAYEAGIITQSPDDLAPPMPFRSDDPRTAWLRLVEGLPDDMVAPLVKNTEELIPLLRKLGGAAH